MSERQKKTAMLNALWGSLVVEELIRCGVEYFCISPGSRSTPLTIAVARHKRAKSIICYDERGAAFHALGYARATQKPAALICTSGTALANYFPAIIEASIEHLPMLVLSADRPPELRETGANQTIRQPGMFGDYLRWQFDFPCPDSHIPLTMILTTIDQAVYKSRTAPGGVAHLNFMFREPFVSTLTETSPPGNLPERWQNSSTPFTMYSQPIKQPSNNAIGTVAGLIRQSKRGILSVGRIETPAEIAAIKQLADRLQWPVFADITSGLRLGSRDGCFIPFFDQLLLCEKFSGLQPDTIIHIGGKMVSKRWLQFAGRQRDARFVVAANHPDRYDPNNQITHRIDGDIALFCHELTAHLPADAGQSDWLNAWKTGSDIAGQIVDIFVAESLASLSEIITIHLISRHIHSDSGLFLSSSLPIREMDMFAASDGPAVRVAANRGASGIDGTIAAATGFAAGLPAPATLVMGDLAFLHDLNSLTLLTQVAQPVIIVVLNNRGGGIFHFLPIAGEKDVFEKYFATPHNYDFRNAAKLFKLRYLNPKNLGEFVKGYQRWQKSGTRGVIEIFSDREDNVNQHKALQTQITNYFEANPPGGDYSALFNDNLLQ